MLNVFLDNKPLYYDKIDYARMPRVYESVKSYFKTPKIIHIIGTNGKGTTGRFLATALHSLGFAVGHYTSPHILNFNERIWLNGSNASDEALNEAHEELLNVLVKDDSDSLSYFEYTTFLAMWIYKDVDYVVCEAGLGGEHDATSAFNNALTLVTPIDMDHQAFLGDSVAKIATTKLKAVQKFALLSAQTHEEVYDVASEVLNAKGLSWKKDTSLINADDEDKILTISQKLSLAPYLQNNLRLAIAALKQMGLEYCSDDFANSKLFGRLSRLAPNVILDVGHNPLAAKAILDALKGEKYVLVYNSYKDKNYKEILRILKPIIESVELIKIVDARAVEKEILQETLKELGIVYSSFEKIDEEKKYLVFGSFSVAEAFLKVHHG